jgi:hypothetical protein
MYLSENYNANVGFTVFNIALSAVLLVLTLNTLIAVPLVKLPFAIIYMVGLFFVLKKAKTTDFFTWE